MLETRHAEIDERRDCVIDGEGGRIGAELSGLWKEESRDLQAESVWSKQYVPPDRGWIRLFQSRVLSGLGSGHSTIVTFFREAVWFSGLLCFAKYCLFVFGCAGSSLQRGLSLAAASGGCSFRRTLASHCGGLSRCGARALGTRAQYVQLGGLSSCASWT